MLKYYKDLKKQGKFIGKESSKYYLKLLSSSTMVYNKLNWKIRDH